MNMKILSLKESKHSPLHQEKLNKKRAGDTLQTFITEAFTKEGYKEVEHQPKENNNCKWCPFYKTHLCSLTFQK
jgi:hypothetical protein